MILDRLIEQTIAFLERRGSVPYHHGPIDEETYPLVRTLVEINRNGFVTTNSQPGTPMQTYVWPDGSRHEATQRSFLTGICTTPLAMFLHDRLNRTDKVIVERPLAFANAFDRLDNTGATAGERWVVTLLDDKPLTTVGHWIDELSLWEPGISPKSSGQIAMECCAVAIMDPVWGRDALHSDGLLPQVLKALLDKGRPPG